MGYNGMACHSSFVDFEHRSGNLHLLNAPEGIGMFVHFDDEVLLVLSTTFNEHVNRGKHNHK
jgi:hypothetical protein